MLAERSIEHVLQPSYGYGNVFDVGLEVVLEGIATRLKGQGNDSGGTQR